jgi:hypothetical protein
MVMIGTTNKELNLEQKLFILANVGYDCLDSRNPMVEKILQKENLLKFLDSFGLEIFVNEYRNTSMMFKTSSDKSIYRPFHILYTLMGNHPKSSRKYFNTRDTSYKFNEIATIGEDEGEFNFKEKMYYLKLSTFRKFVHPFVVKNYKRKIIELGILFKEWRLPFAIKEYKNAVNVVETKTEV